MDAPSPALESLLALLRRRLHLWARSGAMVAAAREALALHGHAAGLRSLNEAWAGGDFSRLPTITLLPDRSLPGIAGAYASSTVTIYLNASWLASQPEAAALAVLTEELGHWLDHQLNKHDTPGDEGELLARLMLGAVFSEGERQFLRQENDAVAIRLGDGSTIEAEAATTPPGPTIHVVTTTADQTDGSAANGLSLREAILLANATPDQEVIIQLTGGSSYFLTASGSDEDLGQTGDLDITARTKVLVIEPTGAAKATISASRLLTADRVLDISSSSRVALGNTIISGGLTSDDGGGIRIAAGGFAYLVNSEVSSNQGMDGGGIYNAGLLYITGESLISSNTASGIGPSGGGIENDGILFIRDSTISLNDGGSYGGGIHNYKTATLINSSVIGNTAKSGGGIMNHFFDSQLSLLNTTVSGNSAELAGAGGIANDGGLVRIVSSTITENTFSGILGYAGGISNEDRTDGVTLRNSIVAGNFKADTRLSSMPDLSGSFRGNAFNLIGSLSGATGTVGLGSDLVGIDPLLAPLADNGGGLLSHALLLGSPAIDRGGYALIPIDQNDDDQDGNTADPFPWDQRGSGYRRLQGASMDIGALEMQPEAALRADVSISLPTSRVAEDLGTSLAVVFRRTGPVADPLVVTYSVTGQAEAGLDYRISGSPDMIDGMGSVLFAAGSATAVLSILPIADNLSESDESLEISINPGAGYTFNSLQSVTGTIGNDDLPLVSLSISPTSISEAGGTPIRFTISRSGATIAPLRVQYSLSGTAALGEDVLGPTAGSGTHEITIPAGASMASLDFLPIPDTQSEDAETITISILPDTRYTVGTPEPQTSRISDAPVPTLLTVTTAVDQMDGTDANGLSLREAIHLANANPAVAYEIRLSGGLVYELTASGVDEDAGLTGDLDISTRTSPLLICTSGTVPATINASKLLQADRILDARPGSRLSLRNLHLTGGATTEYGGAIRIGASADVSLDATSIRDNSALKGGGVYNNGVLVIQNKSSVSLNAANDLSGGGINNNGTLLVSDSTISSNSSKSYGGGLYNYNTATLINSSVIGNTGRSGGGIINHYSGAQLSLLNTTVSGNSADLAGAGGIANDGGLVTIVNSTITDNTFSGILSYAGGISSEGRINGVTLRNSLVAGNFKTDTRLSAMPDLSGSFRGNAFNLIGNLSGATGTVGQGSDLVSVDPLLAPLADNGGGLLTHALLPGSPAIDRGDNTLIPVDQFDADQDGDSSEAFPWDQRGASYVRVNVGRVDIGAVERQTSAVELLAISVTVVPESSPLSIAEDGERTLRLSFRRTGALTSPLTVAFAVGGSASAGEDYNSSGAATFSTTTGTILFSAGSESVDLLLDPVADARPEGDETISIELQSSPDYSIATPGALVGTILNDDSWIETQGTASLIRHSNGNAFVQTGATIQAVSSPHGAAVGSASTTWQMLAAESVAGVNTILFRYNPTNKLHTWNLNANWAWQSASGLIEPNSTQAHGLESAFQLDLNGDSVIGAPYTTIENRGSTSLLRHSNGNAFVQTGATIQAVSSPHGTAVGSASTTWQMLAAESIAGVNTILFRYNPTNKLHTWNLNANWAWQSASGLIEPNSTQAH
ncbi:MAG: choice-of-anchor Q domain-containing protein, partial [Cyanobium sp.]